MSESLMYRSCEIFFGQLEDRGFNSYLKENYGDKKKIVITDDVVFDIWIDRMLSTYGELIDAEVIKFPAGELNKTLENCQQIWREMSEYQISRDDLIINLGGGMVTDLGGFVASLFKRGMPFINIPTTLLSQVDASLGGKTGIDLGPYKNQIGVFSDPKAVFIDSAFLETQEEDEIRSGFAEMLKHGLIADRNYWSDLLGIRNLSDISIDLIRRSVEIKKGIVESDYTESAERKLLNFGHTIGHAMEGLLLAKNTPRPHGHCVAYGMLAEAYLSQKRELLSKVELDQIEGYVRVNYRPLALTTEDTPALIELMKNDKKNRSGEILVTLINGIGNAVYDEVVEETELALALGAILGA